MFNKKIFVVSTDNRNPDDFEAWVVGVFNSMGEAKDAEVVSIIKPIYNFKASE